MATDRTARLAVPAAAALLLWPALWNGYPIVFADTGTYLSQAIRFYAGWDRPVFYSLFMLPLHWRITVWPVIVAQALLAAWVLRLVCHALAPGVSGTTFIAGVGILSACTWLPWLVCELMPDLFTPLLVLSLCLLALAPDRLSRTEQVCLAGLATLMIATQQSSLPLTAGVLMVLTFMVIAGRVPISIRPRDGGEIVGVDLPQPIRHGRACPGHPRFVGRCVDSRDTPGHDDEKVPPLILTPAGRVPAMTDTWLPIHPTRPRRWPLLVLPPALALFALCSVNLAAHGRFAVSPFGNIFLLARVIYDGPGMAALHRDCPVGHWRLCPFLDDFPPTSDEFLWTHDSPLNRAGGPKIVSTEADAIIEAALRAATLAEIRAGLANALTQITEFASGDGLNPWPAEVSPWIERYFPVREQAAYAAARQQRGTLSVPPPLAQVHEIVDLAGIIACALLVPGAFRRRTAHAGFLLAVLLVLPLSAAITGGLSAPHDRYQARIMWLPPFAAVVSFAALRRRSA
ncbi:hypothetical protein [Acidisphaera sp. S103]|uniref:hypothetical protein n=1 Tax=Acidisphaera sp. S103 TaxID=1747223 RepID=UPI00131B94A5|nr:hypothetical protein [Acidisphaera sp. S103]